VTAPDDLAALTRSAARAAADAQIAEAGHDQAEAALAQAEETLAALPDRAKIQLAQGLHAERVRLAAELSALEEASERAQAETAHARVALKEAEARLEALRRQHAAHDLARDLVSGAPCPVCAQPVSEVPARPQPAGLADAERARRAAAAAHERAAAAAATADGAVQARRARLVELEHDVALHPDPGKLEGLFTAVTAAEATVAEARRAEKDARSVARAARDAQHTSERQLALAWRRFDTARDAVAVLEPPSPDRDDLAGAWASLVAWARAHEPAERAVAAGAAERACALREEYRRQYDQLVAVCAACDVDVRGAQPASRVLQTLARAEADLDRLRADLQRAADLRAQVARETERHQVARALGRHLAANRFERWLLDEAMGRLVDGASDVLRRLSSGHYSLDVDAAHHFQVVDHRNADERRSARTLSGGETFLASLALALTLAEQLAELATGGGGRLESIFLDEGFGTLDGETLDIVAAAVEELGARGRTVGLITHVRELADRVPVRFEVRRTPSTSTVERMVEERCAS
jgi:exonuclease SbcC